MPCCRIQLKYVVRRQPCVLYSQPKITNASSALALKNQFPGRTLPLGHWFDDFTRGLAHPTWSRRSFLTSGAAAGLATLALGRSADAGSGSRVFLPLVLPRPIPSATGDTCVASTTNQGTTVSFSVQSRFRGKALAVVGTIGSSRPTGCPNPSHCSQSNSDVRITFGGTEILHITTMATTGAVDPETIATLNLAYGPPFKGVRMATIRLFHNTLTGNVDGRDILPQPTAAPPNPLQSPPFKFRDGGPPPRLSVDPALADAARGLLDEAQEKIKACQKANPLAAPRHAGADLSGGQTAVYDVAGHFGRTTLDPPVRSEMVLENLGHIQLAQQTSEQCTNCQNNCEEVTAGCNAAAIASCFFGPECLIAGATCITNDVVCHDGCDSHGGACCPTVCGDICCDGFCCGGCCASGNLCSNNVCCSPDRPVGCPSGPGFTAHCCPQGQQCCGQACCPPGQHCSAGQCCPDGQDLCGSACCPTGQCQPGNICCPPGQPICSKRTVCCAGGDCDKNDICCSPPNHVCGGICCPPFHLCCNNVCCQLNDQCVNGNCCPPVRSCGGICCPQGQSCQDPSTQKCGSCRGPFGFPNLAACLGNNSDGSAFIMCCRPGVSCCDRRCCQPGEQCCHAVRGPSLGFGCHLPQLCSE